MDQVAIAHQTPSFVELEKSAAVSCLSVAALSTGMAVAAKKREVIRKELGNDKDIRISVHVQDIHGKSRLRVYGDPYVSTLALRGVDCTPCPVL